MLPKCRTSLLSTVVNQCYQSVALPSFFYAQQATKVSLMAGKVI